MRFIEEAVVEYHGFWGSFWDLIWWFLAVFIFLTYHLNIVMLYHDLDALDKFLFRAVRNVLSLKVYFHSFLLEHISSDNRQLFLHILLPHFLFLHDESLFYCLPILRSHI